MPQPSAGPPFDSSLDLLVRAALSPLEAARRAWADWRERYDIEKTPWAEVRMLGSVAGRIDDLEHDSELRPRLAGIQKFLWVNSQACMIAGATGVKRLVDDDIPCLLIKGAARIAENPRAMAERLIRDVDVLVPLDKAGRAFNLLAEAGWVLTGWQTAQWTDAPIAAHHAWSLSKARAELDLHHFSNNLNRLDGDDDGLWMRARSISWNGVAIKLPSPTDALLLTLTHGARFSLEGGADWAVDAARLVQSGATDWELLVSESELRGVGAVVGDSLAYVDDVLDGPVPPSVFAALRDTCSAAERGELAAYAQTSWPRNAGEEQSLAQAGVGRVQRRIARAGGPPPVLDPRRLHRIGTTRLELRPGAHELKVNLGIGTNTEPFCALETVVYSASLLMQSTVEIIYTAPGLPLGRGKAFADHRGAVRFELYLPTALFRLRRIDFLTLAIFLPAHAGHKTASVQVAWLV